MYAANIHLVTAARTAELFLVDAGAPDGGYEYGGRRNIARKEGRRSLALESLRRLKTLLHMESSVFLNFDGTPRCYSNNAIIHIYLSKRRPVISYSQVPSQSEAHI